MRKFYPFTIEPKDSVPGDFGWRIMCGHYVQEQLYPGKFCVWGRFCQIEHFLKISRTSASNLDYPIIFELLAVKLCSAHTDRQSDKHIIFIYFVEIIN